MVSQTSLKTFEIRIAGIVQGVGFRPFVYQSAKKEGYVGWVLNGGQGVVIRFNCVSEEEASRWMDYIVECAPPLSRIESTEIKKCVFEQFQSFDIHESTTEDSPNLPLTPDFAMCEACKNEIDDSGDRRYEYAFITCTQCGPRYSITHKVPYDRPVTTMDPFPMCPICLDEYNNPLSRRHFSQTNSCEQCGVELTVFDVGQNKLRAFPSEKSKLQFIVEKLVNGDIVAVKGIGGFLLLCDATNEDSILTLRHRKHRPHKPLAVLYPEISSIKSQFQISALEQDALTSAEAPIVLLKPKRGNVLRESIAPNQDSIGVMLPYAPILHYLVKQCNKPLVATSGNISGSPIIYSNQDAMTELDNIADWILMHNREILIPQDDSVIRFSKNQQEKIILRRSRGIAPNYYGGNDFKAVEGKLATGAEMKGSFAFVHQGRCYISQYLGSMDSYLSQQTFDKVLDHLKNVLDFKPEKLLSDLHPGYFSYQWCEETALDTGLQWSKYQHHEAHFAAVLGENRLINTSEPVLGFIWDGTGLARDHNIWGGETLQWKEGKIEHVNDIGNVPHISGDQMSLQPRLPLLAFSHKVPGFRERIQRYFTDAEMDVYGQLINKSRINTSSMGRLFDAVSCALLDLPHISYEGQAAMWLESIARKGEELDGGNSQSRWLLVDHMDLSQQVMEHLLADLVRQTNPAIIAFRFHAFLVKWILKTAMSSGVQRLAFSGGVFQNALLVDLIYEQLSDRFQLYFHKELSPNDEGIAFGQLMLDAMQQADLRFRE